MSDSTASAEQPLPGQTHFVADFEQTPLEATGTVDTTEAPKSQWKEAWKALKGNWLFWVSAVLLLFILMIVIVPGLFSGVDPRSADLSKSLQGPQSGHPFGFDKQGYDVYSRVIHGARASVVVGLLTTIIVMLIGIITGALAGYYGRWVDAFISRVTDIFFAIPLLLAAIVGLSALNNIWPDRGYWGGVIAVVIALAAFGWPQFTRIARGAVLEIKHLEFVDASKAIGSSQMKTLFSHIIPNSLAPVIVTATVSLGVYIVAEATLSFLGIGLPSSIVSWGNDIAAAQSQVRTGSNLHVLLFPAGGLALTVLSFMLLGDAVRDALDPKVRK
jgi:oligopeptide transport system permease protein